MLALQTLKLSTTKNVTELISRVLFQASYERAQTEQYKVGLSTALRSIRIAIDIERTQRRDVHETLQHLAALKQVSTCAHERALLQQRADSLVRNTDHLFHGTYTR